MPSVSIGTSGVVVPVMSHVIELQNAPVAASTPRLMEPDATFKSASVTCAVNTVPVALGSTVPEITPCELSVKPVGKLPLSKLHV